MKIYHNPRCSKSRQALQLILEQGLEPEIILQLGSPPTKVELRDILQKLGKNADDILRKGEADYKAHFTAISRTDEKALIDLLVAYLKVIERPIVVSGAKAVVGRPPEAISILFQTGLRRLHGKNNQFEALL